MALNITQQIYEQVKHSKNPLITFKKSFNADILSASLALALWLKKLDKKAEIVCDQFNIPENLHFLPQISIIKSNIDNLRKLIISLDIAENPVDKFSYKIENNKLHIFVSPKKGELTKEHVFCKNSDYKHDLIFTINTPDLESLSQIYENNPDFFFNIPIINICHLPENEHYGQLNLVPIKSTSTCEVLYDLFNEIDSSLIDENIATCLLTGMIEKTKSFKDSKVTPKSLNIASQLMAAGAQREKIIKNLYQTKKVSTLKLWGIILHRLQTDEKNKIAWSYVTWENFKQTRTASKDLIDVMEELIASVPTIELTAIFFQTNKENIHCLIKTEKNINLMQNFSEFQPQGNPELIRITLNTDELSPAKDQVLEYLKNMT